MKPSTGLLALHHCGIGRRIGRIATNQAVAAFEKPNVSDARYRLCAILRRQWTALERLDLVVERDMVVLRDSETGVLDLDAGIDELDQLGLQIW